MKDKNSNLEKKKDSLENLEEISGQEKLVSNMKVRLNNLLKEKADVKKMVRYTKREFLLGIGGIIILLLGGNYIVPLFLPVDIVKTVYGSVYDLREIFTTAYNITFSCVVAPVFVGREVFRLHILKRERMGIESATNYLQEALSLEEDKLEKLKENEKIKVDEKEKLEKIDNKLQFKYEFGYNEDKYYEYYQKGILEEKLRPIYTEDEFEEIKCSMEEKEERHFRKERKREYR